jgi:hypothetical protein
MIIGSSNRLLDLKNSIPNNYQFNQLSKNQELASRLLITDLITMSKFNNWPTLFNPSTQVSPNIVTPSKKIIVCF